MALKRIVNSTLRRFGYSIRRTNPPNFNPNRSPYGLSIYAPWTEEAFQAEYAKIKDFTLVSPDRCYILEHFCHYCATLEGEFAECGVYKGGTAYLIASVLEKIGHSKVVHLFDSFEGMPETQGKALDGHEAGDFGDTSLPTVKSYLKPFHNVMLHPGWMPDTFQAIGDRVFCFAHIDVDIYRSVYDCCQFFYPRMVKGGVILFDDYGFTYYKEAAKKAVDEYFADKPELICVLPTGQGLVLKQ